jgi:hypothetical protein
MTKTTTKLKSLILVGLVAFTFSACEKDKGTGTNADNIVGVWTISSSTINATVNGVSMVQFLVDALGLDQAQAEEMATALLTPITGTITFKSDGTYSTNSDGSIDNGTWELSSDNKKLTLDAGTADEVIMDVETLTSSKLVISFSQTDVEDLDGDDVADTMVMNMKVTCTK